VRRLIGAGDLWATEYVLIYDGRGGMSYTVSIMGFLDGKVARETQYFGDPSSRGLNVSSEMPGIGSGVLIRALEPLEGIHAAKSRHRALARLGARTRKADRGIAG